MGDVRRPRAALPPLHPENAPSVDAAIYNLDVEEDYESEVKAPQRPPSPRLLADYWAEEPSIDTPRLRFPATKRTAPQEIQGVATRADAPVATAATIGDDSRRCELGLEHEIEEESLERFSVFRGTSAQNQSRNRRVSSPAVTPSKCSKCSSLQEDDKNKPVNPCPTIWQGHEIQRAVILSLDDILKLPTPQRRCPHEDEDDASLVAVEGGMDPHQGQSPEAESPTAFRFSTSPGDLANAVAGGGSPVAFCFTQEQRRVRQFEAESPQSHPARRSLSGNLHKVNEFGPPSSVYMVRPGTLSTCTGDASDGESFHSREPQEAYVELQDTEVRPAAAGLSCKCCVNA